MARNLLFLAVGVVLLLAADPAQAAPAPKVDVCHPTGDGGILLLNVSENALGGHLGHGDWLPLDFFEDADGDGYGDAQVVVEACEVPVGYVEDSADCDDQDATIFPGATEVCDGKDNDCDGIVDESGCGAGPCCEPHPGPGCDDLEAMECVCQIVPHCCDFWWDELCVDIATWECGICEPPYPVCGNGLCEPGEDPGNCPEDCGGLPYCGDGICDPGEDDGFCPEDCGVSPWGGPCCEPHPGPGCDDLYVAECVCLFAPHCCVEWWDELCVDIATWECGVCEPPYPVCGDGLCEPGEDEVTCPEDCGGLPWGGPCCEPHPGPGCDDLGVMICVCEFAPHCCDIEWDFMCVEMATWECGACGPPLLYCGDGICDPGEDEVTCPEDCVVCIPDCTGKECGEDGCGASCGTCLYGEECIAGMCQEVAVGDEAIRVELTWHTPGDPDQSDQGPYAGSDLDIHFLHPLAAGLDLDGDDLPDGWFDMPFDCFWFNYNPDWGSPAAMNDPMLIMDDIDGAGPEVIVLSTPEDVTYRVGVHYGDDHGYGPSFATVRVYRYSQLVFELADVELVKSDMWEVCTIAWPSGEVMPVIGPGGGFKITPQYQNPLF